MGVPIFKYGRKPTNIVQFKGISLVIIILFSLPLTVRAFKQSTMLECENALNFNSV